MLETHQKSTIGKSTTSEELSPSSLTIQLSSLDTSLSNDKLLFDAFIDFKNPSTNSFSTFPLSVFLDDGCNTLALIDKTFVSKHNIPFRSLSTPFSVSLANDSFGGTISQITEPLTLSIGPHSETISFLIYTLSVPITLGLPWMKLHNPKINWRDLTLSFSDPICAQKGHLHSISRPSFNISLCSSQHSSSSFSESFIPSQTPTVQSSSDIKLINAASFLRVARKFKLDIYSTRLDITLSNIPAVSIRSVLTTKQYATSEIPLDPRGVPLKYREFADIFSLKTEPPGPLPSHRSYDLEINFLHDSTGNDLPLPRPGKIYPLSPSEEHTLSEYLTNALDRGWISKSTSPLGAPCFFVKKPNGGFRLCIDYRGLNSITKKNRYPLPLLQDMIDKLSKASIFTHLDLPDAYHLVRIKRGDEWKTAFRSKFGSFEYNVIPFGLSNAPSAFQFFMNDIFSDLLGVTVLIYLDDILIFSDNQDDHAQHVKEVLQRLRDHNLTINPTKCSFDLSEVDFFGLIVSKDGIKMDPTKVEAIINWPTPTSVRDIQVFIGFANFYRRFIKNFSSIIEPLLYLTRKTTIFNWNDSSQQAFDTLKSSFSSASILRYYDFSKQAIVEPDASDFAIGSVLSQFDNNGVLHPIAFHSRRFSPPEINYDIHDKELLAIIDSFKVWRHYLISADPDNPTLVLSDHKNLVPFLEARQLNRRQFRWAEILSDFSFHIVHRPGDKNCRADALSRRPDYRIQPNDILDSKNYIQLFTKIQLSNITILNSNEPFLNNLRQATSTSTLLQDFNNNRLSSNFTLQDDILYFNGLLVIPTLDLQLTVFKECHMSAAAGHFGIAKTQELITRDYYWPHLRKSIRRMIKNCDACQRAKPTRHAPYGLLHALPVPTERWIDLSMDFITDLPVSNTFDSIFVVKDRLSKQAHFIPTNKTITGSQTADLFIKEIFRLHGSPRSIVSDRGPQFISAFWKRFSELLQFDINLSSAFHPETDGSTEVLNQTIEQYLRIFCSFQQNDWTSHLPLSEFCYNNTINSSTNMTPFFANSGHHPLFGSLIFRDSTVPAAEERVQQLQTILNDLQANLKEAQAAYTIQANKSRLPTPDIQPNDLVFLDRRNIKTIRPSRKLDDKKLGPFKVLRQINPVAFELKLPTTMKIHPVFHVSLLEPKTKDTIQQMSTPAPPPPIEIDQDLEYEVESILDSKISRKKLFYLVHWKGYDTTENSWEPTQNLLNSQELINDFHNKHPQRPK